jgi:hypothetical protein
MQILPIDMKDLLQVAWQRPGVYGNTFLFSVADGDSPKSCR